VSGRRRKIRKNFTVEEANATLPLVRAIVKDLSELSREVIERRERLSILLGGRARDVSDPYSEELAQIEEELDKDNGRLRELVEELLELGVEPKSVTDGLVDFPALLDGRPVYYCWKLGEPEVLHWHERDAGYRGRQPLTAGAVDDEQFGNDTDTGSES
jgi:hypothetical protein